MVAWHKDFLKFFTIITVSSLVSSLVVFAIERSVVANLQNQVTELQYEVATLKGGAIGVPSYR